MATKVQPGPRTFDAAAAKQLADSFTKKWNNASLLLQGGEAIPSVEVIPLDDPVWDKLMAGDSEKGGIMRASIIEISGSNSSGKSTIALEYTAKFMEMFPDRGVFYCDIEGAFDKDYARHIGVDVDSPRFNFSRPLGGKEAVTVINYVIESGMYSLVVVDSWASIIPPNEEDADQIGDHSVGGLALLSSKALRVYAGSIKQYDTTMIILNQERVNLTAMGARGKTTTGGSAMGFYPHMRISINREKKDSDVRVVEIIKSKCQAKPSTKANLEIKHDMGIDRIASLFNLGLESGDIKAAGAWYSVPEVDKKAQGKEAFFEMVRKDKDLLAFLCKKLNVPVFKPRGYLTRKVLGAIEPSDT